MLSIQPSCECVEGEGETEEDDVGDKDGTEDGDKTSWLIVETEEARLPLEGTESLRGLLSTRNRSCALFDLAFISGSAFTSSSSPYHPSSVE